MKIKINTDLMNYKEGDIVDIKSNSGVPLDRYWRRRIKDSKIDNCISIIPVDTFEKINRQPKEIQEKNTVESNEKIVKCNKLGRDNKK